MASKIKIAKVRGVGPVTALALEEFGIKSVRKLAKAKPKKLAAVPGIGPIRAQQLIDAALLIVTASPGEMSAKKPKKISSSSGKKTRDKKSRKKVKKSKKNKPVEF